MAITSYPFESANTTEDQYTLLFRNFADTGIVGSYADTQFVVSTDSSGLDVQVSAGYAIVRGHAVANDGPVTVNIDPADATHARIDRIVLRLDPDQDSIRLHVIKGTPSATPAVPPIVQTDVDIYDLPIARVTVPASALNLLPANLAGERYWGGNRVGVWDTSKRPTAPPFSKMGYNLDLGYFEWWNGTAWVPLTNNVKKVVVPHTFTLAGPVVTANGDDYYVPPMIVPVPPSQSVRLVGTRTFLRSGGSVTFELWKYNPSTNASTKIYGPTVAGVGASNPGPGAGSTFSDGESLLLVVTGLSGAPKNLSVSCFLEYTV